MLGKIDKNPQLNIFQTPLEKMINLKHELCLLAEKIDWDNIEKEFNKYYKDIGRPSVPVRKIVGLILLKQIYNQSDESVIERWIENPYWQYFCGETYFQFEQPFDPSDFVHFRDRIGEEGAEKLLKLSIDLFGKASQEKEVLIDTTVQEKNITFPTDVKLQKKIIDKCIKIAKQNNIELRQSYTRVVKQLMIDQRFRNHPKRRKKARAAARKIKTIAGRLTRELQRKLPNEVLEQHMELFKIFQRVLQQERNSKNKIYSIHEPEVSCIAKGKDSKPYEFGNKSSIVLTKTTGVIVGAMAFKRNIYDGHTLEPQLNQTKRLRGTDPKVAIVDRGYKGKKSIGNTEIVKPGPISKSANNYQKQKKRKRCRARAAIEPIIGHLKHDHKMIRNYLKGSIGDSMNTLLSGAAFNFKKMLNQLKQEAKASLSQIIKWIFQYIFLQKNFLTTKIFKISPF
jgi:IS5 family transposase